MYVYVDLFLGLNILLNTCMMVLTAKLCGERIIWLKIILSAAVGGIYALGALYFGGGLFYWAPIKFAVSLLLIHIAFSPQTLRTLFQVTAAYYCSCFITGGAVAGFYFYRQTIASTLTQQLGSFLGMHDLLIGASLAFGLLYVVKTGFLANVLRNSTEYKLEIEFNGSTVTLPAILDTGNALYSAGLKPVIIAELGSVLALLSREAHEFLTMYPPQEWAENLYLCNDKDWLDRVQLIPFRALVGSNMLVSFRPDIVRVQSGKKIVETSEVVIGVYAGTLFAKKHYTALLHPAILNLSVRKGVKTCVSPG